MRRKMVVIMLILAACWIGRAAAAAEKSQPSVEPKLTEQEKNLLVSNINAMRNQEMRVMVLQQLLNEEYAKLVQMQAVFCDQYKLNPEKFRTGKYTFDDKTGEFIESK